MLLDKDVSGYTLVTVGTDLASAERQATPLLAEDLAQNISELITEARGEIYLNLSKPIFTYIVFFCTVSQ